jgi:hypothetical protein
MDWKVLICVLSGYPWVGVYGFDWAHLGIPNTWVFVCFWSYHIDRTGKGIGKSIGTGLLRVGLAGLVWLLGLRDYTSWVGRRELLSAGRVYRNRHYLSSRCLVGSPGLV